MAAASFLGEQLHARDYPGPEPLNGRRTLVVGGGASAAELLGETGDSHRPSSDELDFEAAEVILSATGSGPPPPTSRRRTCADRSAGSPSTPPP